MKVKVNNTFGNSGASKLHNYAGSVTGPARKRNRDDLDLSQDESDEDNDIQINGHHNEEDIVEFHLNNI